MLAYKRTTAAVQGMGRRPWQAAVGLVGMGLFRRPAGLWEAPSTYAPSLRTAKTGQQGVAKLHGPRAHLPSSYPGPRLTVPKPACSRLAVVYSKPGWGWGGWPCGDVL